MKKMLCIMLSLIMVLGLLSGCDSLFTSGDEGGAAGGSTGDIKMTDKYTFTDPTDLTFETRYSNAMVRKLNTNAAIAGSLIGR